MRRDLFRARVGWFRVRVHEDRNAQIARDCFGLAERISTWVSVRRTGGRV